MTAARLERAGDGEYAVVGDLTFATVSALYREPIPELERPGVVAMHLEPVTRTDSAGLALLIDWARRAQDAGGRVEFSGLPDQLRTLVRVCGLDEVLSVSTSQRDKVESENGNAGTN